MKVIIPSDLSTLKITEIHYNPIDQNDIDGENFEFIELKNNGANNIDLLGLSIIDGIDYRFDKELDTLMKLKKMEEKENCFNLMFQIQSK